jgi:hypothetical protein
VPETERGSLTNAESRHGTGEISVAAAPKLPESRAGHSSIFAPQNQPKALIDLSSQPTNSPLSLPLVILKLRLPWLRQLAGKVKPGPADRCRYRGNIVTTKDIQALTVELYGLYVAVVQEIAQGEGDDPYELCDTQIRGVAERFQDRPWAPLAKRR